jgi:hypothetical protein
MPRLDDRQALLGTLGDDWGLRPGLFLDSRPLCQALVHKSHRTRDVVPQLWSSAKVRQHQEGTAHCDFRFPVPTTRIRTCMRSPSTPGDHQWGL